ncbi:MAG TPA: hypothetical protein VF103_11890, partial [Polyangiaceae bacterium]
MTLGRRQACLGAATLFASLLRTPKTHAAECTAFESRTLEISGERLARRCELLVPRGSTEHRRVLVLLHGLGETKNEALGIRAWADRYGLCEAHERLHHPPVRRVLGDAVYLTDERLSELERELA